MLATNHIANHHSATADIYTDFSGLNQLKQLANTDGKAALEQVASQFESIFLNIALKSMRQANEAFAKDSYFNSNQSRMYQDMLDQQLSVTMTQGKGLGLADTLVRQMAKYVETVPSNTFSNTVESGLPANDRATQPGPSSVNAYQDLSKLAERGI